MARIGLLGGSFDPVHFGHLLLAEQSREQCALDQVWLVPTGTPPHKAAPRAPAKARIEMLELALAGHAAFRVEPLELERAGAAYTVETLERLRTAYPDHEFYFLAGADSLRDFPNWRQPSRILELAVLVIINRGGHPPPDLQPVIEQVDPAAAERVRLVEMPGFDVSSRDLRRRLGEGRSIRYMTPRAVECYIGQHGLYGPAAEKTDANA